MPPKKSRKTGKTGKKSKSKKKKELQKQLFSPFPTAVTSRRRYRQRAHPVESIAGLLPGGQTKKPAWYLDETERKYVYPKKEVKKLLDELENIHGFSTDLMTKNLLEDQHRFFVGKSKMLDVPKLAEFLQMKSVTRFKDIDYSQVPVKINFILMFINQKRLSELIKGKFGKKLPLAVRAEQTRQENHLKSIWREAKKHGMQKRK
jgi:hypothetical protein